jgi:hypothetical protein
VGGHVGQHVRVELVGLAALAHHERGIAAQARQVPLDELDVLVWRLQRHAGQQPDHALHPARPGAGRKRQNMGKRQNTER